jgi:hypothetical protein
MEIPGMKKSSPEDLVSRGQSKPPTCCGIELSSGYREKEKERA